MFICWTKIQELGEEIVCPCHLSCTSPWLQLKLSSANTKRCLYEIGKWPHCWDSAHRESSCCTGPVWGQSWKIECQIRFIQWVGLLINFPLLVQVQRRWDRADSQMGRSRSRLLSLNDCQFSHWLSFCVLCCRRTLKSDFWGSTAPVTVRSESDLRHAGKDGGYRAAPASAAGLVCLGKHETSIERRQEVSNAGISPL